MPGCYRYPLLPLAQVIDRVRDVLPAGLEAPQRLAGRRIKGEEKAFIAPAEYQPARGGYYAGPGRREQIILPAQFTGGGIEGADGAKSGVAGNISHAAAVEFSARFVIRFAFEIQTAAFAR